MEGVDENGNPLPRLKLDKSDPEHPKWIAADDAPPPLPPLYKHDKTVVGHRPAADSEANRKLDDAVARRERAIAADQAAERKLAEAKQAHDSNPTPENKQRHEAADRAHKPAHTEMRDASEDLGDKTAEHHAVPENFTGAQRIDDRTTGNNRFDQIWNRTGDHYVVVEAKAPSADLGSRESVTGRQVMQGHPEYFNAILAQMEKRGLTDPVEAELSEKLHQALEDGKLDYVLVKARVKDGEYDGYTMKHFNID